VTAQVIKKTTTELPMEIKYIVTLAGIVQLFYFEYFSRKETLQTILSPFFSFLDVRFGRKRNSTTQWDERRPESRF
jgi:hypothetical protein